MKTFFALFLIFAACSSRAELPTTTPESAVFVTSCHQIVTALIVMPDGKTLFFDSHSKESADDVKALAAKSKNPARVYEVGCYKEEGINI